MLNKLKLQKGITGIDLTISIIIIMIFVSIIAALSINVSSSLASKRRLEIATNCMAEIMEKLDSINYTDVLISEDENENNINNILERDDTVDEFESQVKSILSKEEYKILTVGLKKQKYENEEEGKNTQDLIKKVTVTIVYKLNNKEEKVEVTRLKTRYNVNLEGTGASTTN